MSDRPGRPGERRFGTRPSGRGPSKGRRGGPSGAGRRPLGHTEPAGTGGGGWGRSVSASLRVFRRGDPLRRLSAGLVCMAFVLSMFVGRLVQLQGIESHPYKMRAEQERTVNMTLPAIRGKITDDAGHPFAMTVEARGIYADPVHLDAKQVPRIVRAVSRAAGVSTQAVTRRLDHPTSRQFTYLAHGVSPQNAQHVLAMNFKGIGAQREYKRDYPDGSLASSVIGLVGNDQHGLVGLEYTKEHRLAGHDGHQRVQIGLHGQVIPTAPDVRKPPHPGHGVGLTLDRDIQWKAETALRAQVRKTRARSGAVVVMDPHTGKLFALASTPSFDPSRPATARSGSTTNHAVSDVYEPGSANKVITAAAAMEKGGLGPRSPITVPPTLRRDGTVFHDAERHGTQRLTFAGVLAKSSNIGTMLASEKISKRTLYDYMRAFGFGAKTRIGLPGETAGLLPASDKWSGTQRYTIAFGQGVSVNAVQMASVYSTVANNGVRVAPSLVAGHYDGHGHFVSAGTPEGRRVISAHTAKQLRRMLVGVTAPYGTAPKAKIPGYRVAGKTGTAQRADSACHCYRGYTASFVGMAPADDPKLVTEVVLQDPETGHYGGQVAAPVFRNVMSFALKTRKIPPSGGSRPRLPIYAR